MIQKKNRRKTRRKGRDNVRKKSLQGNFGGEDTRKPIPL